MTVTKLSATLAGVRFEDVAKIVGKTPGSVRVSFSRYGWKIGKPADVTAYLEFVKRPTRYTKKRAASSADHLANYRFQTGKRINHLLPTLVDSSGQLDTRDIHSWIRHARYHGQSKRLLPEARHALRELATGLLQTSPDLIGLIITSPYLTETPTRLVGIIGVYASLPNNQELAEIATMLATEQSKALGLPVHYLPTDALQLETTLRNPANSMLTEWLTTSRVEYGYTTLPI